MHEPTTISDVAPILVIALIASWYGVFRLADRFADQLGELGAWLTMFYPGAVLIGLMFLTQS